MASRRGSARGDLAKMYGTLRDVLPFVVAMPLKAYGKLHVTWRLFLNWRLQRMTMYTWTLYVFTRSTKAKYLQWRYRRHPFIPVLPRGNCIVPVFSLFPLCFNPCRCISRPIYECILWLYGCKSMLRVKTDCKQTQFWCWLRLRMLCLSVWRIQPGFKVFLFNRHTVNSKNF